MKQIDEFQGFVRGAAIIGYDHGESVGVHAVEGGALADGVAVGTRHRRRCAHVAAFLRERGRIFDHGAEFALRVRKCLHGLERVGVGIEPNCDDSVGDGLAAEGADAARDRGRGRSAVVGDGLEIGHLDALELVVADHDGCGAGDIVVVNDEAERAGALHFGRDGNGGGKTAERVGHARRLRHFLPVNVREFDGQPPVGDDHGVVHGDGHKAHGIARVIEAALGGEGHAQVAVKAADAAGIVDALVVKVLDDAEGADTHMAVSHGYGEAHAAVAVGGAGGDCLVLVIDQRHLRPGHSFAVREAIDAHDGRLRCFEEHGGIGQHVHAAQFLLLVHVVVGRRTHGIVTCGEHDAHLARLIHRRILEVVSELVRVQPLAQFVAHIAAAGFLVVEAHEGDLHLRGIANCRERQLERSVGGHHLFGRCRHRRAIDEVVEVREQALELRGGGNLRGRFESLAKIGTGGYGVADVRLVDDGLPEHQGVAAVLRLVEQTQTFLGTLARERRESVPGIPGRRALGMRGDG